MLLRPQRPKSRRRLTRMRSVIPRWTMCQGAVGRTQLFVLSRSLRPSEFKRQRDRFGSCRAFTMTDTPADGASVISFLRAAALGANRPPRRSPPFARDPSTRASSGSRSGDPILAECACCASDPRGQHQWDWLTQSYWAVCELPRLTALSATAVPVAGKPWPDFVSSNVSVSSPRAMITSRRCTERSCQP